MRKLRMKRILFPGFAFVLLLVLAACSSDPTATRTAPTATTTSTTSSGETVLTSSGLSFKFQYACINRTLNPCELLAAEGGMMDRIRERTNGQVDIQISSFPELGLAGPDTLRLIEDGTLGMAEIYSGYVGGDYPAIDAANLWGLIPNNEVNLKIIDAVAGPVKADLLEKFGAVVIGESYYPNNYYYTGRPLRTVADFKGMKTRSHSTVLADLINGMDADAQFMAFSEVYTGLERGILDAAVTCGVCGAGLRWFEVTDYLVGPIVALGVTYISVNKARWDEIPTDLQNIILEEGIKHQAINRALVTDDWVKEGLEENVAGGMEYIEFTPEIKAALKKAAMEQVVPKWVERVGGPDADAVKMYNTYVAPLLGVSIDSNGQAVEN